MHIKNDQLRLSATDLANHLACNHLTELNLAKAHRLLDPPYWHDPMLEVLQKRGDEHEQAYLDHLASKGTQHERISADNPNGFTDTLSAMQAGIAAIVQAPLGNDRWRGIADVLLRLDKPSSLGSYSYEVVDTKLARETRGGTILQLCLYSELVSGMQGCRPESMYVVSPGEDFVPERFRVDDYVAYFRMVKAALDENVTVLDSRIRGNDGELEGEPLLYPDPCEHCSICRWWKRCNERRRTDDHLTFVAGISKSQIKELGARGIGTLTSLGRMPTPIDWRPDRGSKDGIERVANQARVQLEQRDTEQPVLEFLELQPELGFARLPAPSDGDIHFDLESARFAGDHGLQYLWGYAIRDSRHSRESGNLERRRSTISESRDSSLLDPRSTTRSSQINTPSAGMTYVDRWAHDITSEHAEFERFIDMVMTRWEAFPDMHVYHFGHYEPSTLKQLAGRYATREDELDKMLRAELFVDLHSIVKQAIRAGVESYSIKSLEPFFGFERKMDLHDASKARHELERGLEMDVALDEIPDQVRDNVRLYNRDDCLATEGLQAWLETLRAQLIADGATIDRPEVRDGEPGEELEERRLEILALMERLLDGIPENPDEREPEQQAKFLLAHMLEFHRRENKAAWWEFYRMRDLTDEDFLEERNAIAGLEFVTDLPKPGRTRKPRHRYRYPSQDTAIREDDELQTPDGEKFGEVIAIDEIARTIDVAKPIAREHDHPSSVFEFTIYRTTVIAKSLFRLAEWVADNDIQADGPYRAARDLLLRVQPRFRDGFRSPIRPSHEPLLDACKRLGLDLDSGVLPIQGPPGTGKTYIGARMICDLIKAGKKVGVIAHSHKVMDNLLAKLEEAGDKMGVDVRPVHKDGHESDEDDFIQYRDDNGTVLAAIQDGEFNVAAGTVWMWSRQDFANVVDVLVVDEAGQMSLANVVAASQAASSLVLLGDPGQLEQPRKGSHPPGVDTSALAHLLGEHETMPPDRGVFLEETWRLSDQICRYTSETFYQGRLSPRPELQKQWIESGLIPEPGLYIHLVEHEGNQSSSSEEVDAVVELVSKLTLPGSRWTDRDGKTTPLTLNDILIVAPYNAQVSDIAARIPNARVGTVDKFQGQEAPVVIYSMTTSTREDAPRGMEFLYSLNRLNVATSRAKCACILVANPAVLEPDCRNPRQMRLANAFCRYSELARAI